MKRNWSDDKDVRWEGEKREIGGGEREFAYGRRILIDKEEALWGQTGRQTHGGWRVEKTGRKAAGPNSALHIIQIDRFINNEWRKTGEINSVNKCAVSSSAPAPNGLCLRTSFASVYIMHVCSCACNTHLSGVAAHAATVIICPGPHYWCCGMMTMTTMMKMMMMRDSFILPHRQTRTHRHTCHSSCLSVSEHLPRARATLTNNH